jgi:hypothetical protein
MGYRLDHIIVRGLNIAACDYEHAWRNAGLSDHAAMWANKTLRLDERRRLAPGHDGAVLSSGRFVALERVDGRPGEHSAVHVEA